MKIKKRIYKKRERKHLLEHEISIIYDMCERTKFPLRNKLLILMSYNHALRPSETCDLKWSDIDLINNIIHIKRKKNGVSGYHPIECQTTLELLKQHKERRYLPDKYVFMSQYKRPPTKLDPDNYNDLCEKLGIMAGFDFKFTPHMLRHSKPTKLIEDGVNIMVVKGLMGHSKVSSTEIYIHMGINQYRGLTKGSMFA